MTDLVVGSGVWVWEGGALVGSCPAATTIHGAAAGRGSSRAGSALDQHPRTPARATRGRRRWPIGAVAVGCTAGDGHRASRLARSDEWRAGPEHLESVANTMKCFLARPGANGATPEAI